MIFESRQSSYRFPVPFTETEAIKHCEAKGEKYEKTRCVTPPTEDKKIIENLKIIRRNMRLLIQRISREREKGDTRASDFEAEGDPFLYDSTDEEGDGAFQVGKR